MTVARGAATDRRPLPRESRAGARPALGARADRCSKMCASPMAAPRARTRPAPCSPEACQQWERRHNCSLWARSGAQPLCDLVSATKAVRSAYLRKFGGCAECGLSHGLHEFRSGPDGLPSMPARNETVLCDANEPLRLTGDILQASAAQQAAALSRCQCAVRAAMPVLPQWRVDWNNNATAIAAYELRYREAMLFALQGLEGLCTPSGSRIAVRLGRVLGAGVNNFIVSASREASDAPVEDEVVRLRAFQLGPVGIPAKWQLGPDFNRSFMPRGEQKQPRIPEFLLSQPDVSGLVAAGTCTWPNSARTMLVMVLPRGNLVQRTAVRTALNDCRTRGILSPVECQLDAAENSLRHLHSLTHVERFVLREHLVITGKRYAPLAECGLFSAYVHADWDREAAGTDARRRKGRPEPDLRERAADAGSVLKGVRHYRHTQMCFDRRARLMVCDADHVERSPVSPTITVPGSTSFGGAGWMQNHYDVTCAASRTLVQPLVARLPMLSRLVNEIQERHDAIASGAAGGVVQLSLSCAAGWLRRAISVMREK